MHNCTNKVHHGGICDCYRNFLNYEVPIVDGKLMSYDVRGFDCDLLALKVLMIRMPHVHKQEDNEMFWKLWSESWEQYTAIMDTKWILNILEILAVRGPLNTRAYAMIVANGLNIERFAQTLERIIWDVEPKSNIDALDQKPMYNGLKTTPINSADEVLRYFERMMTVLDNNKMIRKLFVEITRRQLNTPKSTIGRLCKVTDLDLKAAILKQIGQ